MQSTLFRITLNSAQPDVLLRFYSILGFQFILKNIEKGSRSWQGQSGLMSLEIYSIKETFSVNSAGVQMSFHVTGIEALVEQFRALGVQIMMEPLETKTGQLAIVMDPDGRAVELFQEFSKN